tara:strand:- start:3416 stop:3685 length:270 start_codon:yes stop_codon:yes gene_type:complete
MKWFDNAEECRIVIESFFGDLSPLDRTKLQMVFDNLEGKSDKEKQWVMCQAFRKCLWSIPEAVEKGFMVWLKTELPNRKAALEYHGELQ